MNELCRTYEWVMSHIWMSYVAHRNESCRTYECVMSHIGMSHVAHMNASCLTYEWVMSHIWMSYVAHMNEPCRTYISHISVSHTCKHLQYSVCLPLCRRYEWGHTYEWVMSHIQMSHVTHISHTWACQTQASTSNSCAEGMSEATPMNYWCCAYKWVIFHIHHRHQC